MLGALAVTLLAVVVVAQLSLRLVSVTSSSMAPTVPDGSRALVRTWQLPGATPERGALVVARVPGGAVVVKRLVARAGDTVALRDGRLHVNDRPLEESSVDLDTVDGTWFGPVRVPAGRVFLLGDNRAESWDSREFGPVALDDVVGEVVLWW